VLLDLGDPVAGVVEYLPAAPGREDQFRPPVARVWAAFQVTELLQLADQPGGRGEAQLRPGGQIGQPDAIDADVAEDVHVRLPHVGVAVRCSGGEQLDPELAQQPAKELADGEPVGGQVS
jgi:hypothetical protein